MGLDLSEQMLYAKQLYLYGDGDKQKPVKSLPLLAKLAGVSVDGIRNHVKKWREVSLNLALMSDTSPYSLSLSEETLTQHREEVNFLGNQVIDLRNEVKLQSKDKLPNYYVALQAYERALTKWEKSSGILAHYATAESAMKERAKAHERAKAKEGAGEKPVKRVVDKSRFHVD